MQQKRFWKEFPGPYRYLLSIEDKLNMNHYSFVIITSTIILISALISRNSAILLMLPPLLIRFYRKKESREFQLEIRREIEERRLHKNGETDIVIIVKNTGHSISRIKVSDNPPPSLIVTEGNISRFTTLKKNSEIRLKYRVQCRRGRHCFGPLYIRTWNHFGLPESGFKYENSDEIIALPDSVKIGSLPINVRNTLVYAGLNPSGQGGDGVYFHDIREYQRGDSLRHIHWSAVARRPEKLITKEFEQERVSDIGIILDAREESYEKYGKSSYIEYGIEAVSALSEILLSLQNRVGLLVYGKTLNWTIPGYGKMQGERIRRSLSVVETGSHQVFKSLKNLPTRMFPEKSQLIFLSPLISTDIDFLRRLKGRGYMIIIICLDSLSLQKGAFDPLALQLAELERDLMIRDLERSGIRVLKWNLNDSIEKLIQVNKGKLRQAVRGNV